MRKSSILTVFLFGFLLIVPSQAMATIYEFSPPDQDMFDLDHHRYYLWGIDWNIPQDQELVSLTLSIGNINNWDTQENILYIHLLDSTTEGLQVFYDNQAGGDNVANLPGILLDTYVDYDGGYNGASEDYSYTFSDSDMSAFLQYSTNGNFGLGFDPDCHFWNDGVLLTIETRNAVPEPATMILFGIGMIGAFVRKKFI